ncbi:MAG: ATP-binding protein [Candidatus Omnitrophota bacterium]
MPYNILIVDDDREYRESFKDGFADFNILEAPTGQEALAILKKPHDIDVVVLDERMPGLSGTQVLEEIKKLDSGIQAVILTSKGSEETAVRALRGKAEDYLQKSLPFEAIERRIRQLAEKVRKPEKPLRGGIEDKIEQMKYFAQRNYHKNIRLNDLAERLFLSQKYLSKIFKQHTGMTYNDYKIKIKIEKAKDMLKNKDFNIYKIAEGMGYQNTESFIRIFERETGYTPTAFRETVRKTGVTEADGANSSLTLKKGSRRQVKEDPASNIDDKMNLLGHEIRSPLGTIRAITYNIRKKNASSALAKDIGKIELMVSETDRIIDNVLLFGKTPQVRPRAVALKEVIDEALNMLGDIAKSRRLRFIRKEKKDLSLETDPLLLRQALVNILQNACQAAPENKGKIWIETSTDKEGQIFISVEDNGPGISKKDLEQVFTPFFTTKSKGAGLGLPVCRKLITLLKGSLAIKSRKGFGVKAVICLPGFPRK